MDSFIERFCAKYYFPYAEGRQLIEGMEYKTYRKGDCLVREGERDNVFLYNCSWYLARALFT